MESNVWTQLFVQAVNYLSSLFAHSNVALKLPNGGESPNVPASDVASTSISKNATTQEQSVLTITRNPKLTTKDGVFGDMAFNGRQLGVSCENKDLMIPEGLYEAEKDMSPRLGYICPHIKVPSRDAAAGGDAGIRIHILNDPNQSEGCIGAGTTLDGDAVDNSKDDFDALMKILPARFKVLVSS